MSLKIEKRLVRYSKSSREVREKAELSRAFLRKEKQKQRIQKIHSATKAQNQNQ